MGRFLIKLNDKKKSYYMEWSTVVDAPTTYGLSLRELKSYIKDEYGNEGLRDLPMRLERIKEHNHSLYSKETVNELIRGNRAGKNERKISVKQIIEDYCINRPKK